MAIHICPNCNKRYTVGWGVTDYVHECNNGNPAIDQEDVVVVGEWVDYTGSSDGISAQEVMRQGMVNELQGAKANIEYGDDKEDETPRGVRTSTHRQRQHLEYINLNKKGLD